MDRKLISKPKQAIANKWYECVIYFLIFFSAVVKYDY